MMRAVDGATARPTEPQKLRLSQLTQETNEAVRTYERLLSTRIAEINELVQSIPAIAVGTDET